MKISERIKTISELISVSENVADIGSDHGYLLIMLAKANMNRKLFGVENKKGPFSSLKKNVEKYDCIDVSLSDGLDELSNEFHSVVIAGIGYDNINKIIQKNIKKLDFINDFYIDSHTNLYELRNFMISLGYEIIEEKIIKENGIFYEIIHFKKGSKNYSELEKNYGPILLKDKNQLFIEKYNQEYKKINDLLSKNLSENRKTELENKRNEIRSILNI